MVVSAMPSTPRPLLSLEDEVSTHAGLPPLVSDGTTRHSDADADADARRDRNAQVSVDRNRQDTHRATTLVSSYAADAPLLSPLLYITQTEHIAGLDRAS
jgi:hypothetical protein